MMIKVVLADDQPLVRGGFAALLEGIPDIEVVGEASNGEEALRIIERERPDVAVLDIRMPVMDGLATTRAILSPEKNLHTKIIILTTFELDEYVFEAIRSGASGFLGKGMDPGDLPGAIRRVTDGEALLSPRAITSLISNFVEQPIENASTVDSRASSLTDREAEVTRMVGLGMSNSEIADALVLSPLTVKTHVSRAMTKVGARDRAQLVVFSFQAGLLRVAEQPPQPKSAYGPRGT